MIESRVRLELAEDQIDSLVIDENNLKIVTTVEKIVNREDLVMLKECYEAEIATTQKKLDDVINQLNQLGGFDGPIK